jgi:hypothetical protein
MNILGYNERTWAIDVIAELKSLAEGRRRIIRGAGGERTLSSGNGSLFPDILLYGDPSGASVLQGWELKMPDTAVTNNELLSNAADKAELLGLDSFLVCNAQTAVLHIRDENGGFSPEKSWTVLTGTVSREDVERRTEEWTASLETIFEDLNDFFERGAITGRSLNETLSETHLITVALETAPALAGILEEAARSNANFRARSQQWWKSVHLQFPDESEPWLPLARLVLLLWVNRLTFAHLLTNWCSDASLVEEFEEDTSPSEALGVFDQISESCDFVNVLGGSLGAEQVGGPPWAHLLQLNAFLSDLELEGIDHELFRAVLNALSYAARRKAAGQFTTPYPLASLIARLVLSDRSATFLDAFCGTGTIPKACLDTKQESGIDREAALGSIWASDKFDIPVQITTLALTQPEAIGVPVRVFAADIAELHPGEEVSFTDPDSGERIVEELPTFECAASNLPFVQFEDLEDVNPEIPLINDFIEKVVGEEYRLPSKSDLYAYMPFYLWRLLEPGARLGIILSNSWLATEFGESFRSTLTQFYEIEQVLISGEGRWFEQSDVVGTVVILQKRGEPGKIRQDEETQFVVTKHPIDDFADPDACNEAEIRIRLSEPGNGIRLNTVQREAMTFYEEAGLQWGAFFGDVAWLHQVDDCIRPAHNFFSIGRGERRGWNPMFYPDEGHNIEDEYLRPVLRTPSSVDGLIATPDRVAFCCNIAREKLAEWGDTGALSWIEHFEEETNTKGQPLPEVLDQRGGYWYEMNDSTVADIVGLVNPGSRLFFPRMKERGFVDQRLIRFTADDEEMNVDLLHALLNSVLSLYYMEAIGFGRGLGALDLNATKIKKRLQMFDPRALSGKERARIIEKFTPLLDRDVLPIREELQQEDRRTFDEAVFSVYGVEEFLPRVHDALLTLHRVRMAAIE